MVAVEEILPWSCKMKDGGDLLGRPTFEELENGRFKCVETGHEMPSLSTYSYANSKRCRMALIDCALSRKKAPLNMFTQHPLSSSKIICTLTGDTINKSEEHIWKHINGKRFLGKLEKVEAERLNSNGVRPDESMPPEVSKLITDKTQKSKSKKLKKKDGVSMFISKKSSAKGNNTKEEEEKEEEEECNFWMPPGGSRWDFDDGRNRWEPDSCQHNNNEAVDDAENGCMELSMRTKRMSIDVEPRSTKKKSKIES